MTAEAPDYKDTLNLPKTDFPNESGFAKSRTFLAREMGKYWNLPKIARKSLSKTVHTA